MALTRYKETGDGVRTVFDVSFDLGYLSKDFVYVYLVDNEYTEQLSYTWLNNTQISLSQAPAAGVEFYIRRVVPRNELVNNYTDGAILREKELNNSLLQLLMIQEEIADGFISVEPEFPIDSVLNMMGNRITNLGDALVDTDAVSLGVVKDLFESLKVSGGSIIREDAPFPVLDGQRWTRCSDMLSFIWYEDEDGGQWVEDNPSMGANNVYSGTGSPEGVLAASVGKIYTDLTGGAGTTLYVKESGTGNIGWVAK